MSEIKRYAGRDPKFGGGMGEHHAGSYVLHIDHVAALTTERAAREAAEAAVARMEGELAGLRAMLQRIADNGFSGPTWSAVRAPTHAELRALLEGGAG